MKDTETLGSKKDLRHDMPQILASLIKKINWKVALFLIIFSVLIFSDIFIENVLSMMNDTLYGGIPNTKGTVVQILTLTVLYILIDLLVQGGVI
jgi:hypothetical protein